VLFLVRSTLLLILLVASATNAWSADGRILNFEGDVRVNGQPVTASTVLQREDTIVTAEGASVRIVLSDNSVLDLDSDSEIQLSDYSYDPAAPENNKSEISVVEGSLRYVSGLIAKEDPDDIGFTAGNSTIGVRGSFTGIAVVGAVVHVKAMIGTATLQQEDDEGKKDTFTVSPGQTTLTDPSTGKVSVAPSTVSDPINTVVRAIAAISPDATDSRDEGCSRGKNPLRATANPDGDVAALEEIEKQLAALSEGELMMVMAVLINNGRHLCTDSFANALALNFMYNANPDAALIAAALAASLDPDNSDKYDDPANSPADNQSPNDQPSSNQPPPIESEIPPGGTGGPPSPE
jgi:hypothetical protein